MAENRNAPNQQDPQQLAAVQAAIRTHPDVMAKLQQGDTSGAAYLLRSQYGIDIPAGHELQRDGTVKYVNVTDPWFARNLSWLGPLIVGGSAAGVGALAGAAGGGSAAPTASAAMPAQGGITTGMITNTAPSLGLATAPPTAGGAGTGALGFLGKNWRDLLGATGAGIGAISQTQAANRGEEFGGQGLLAALQGQADRDFSNQSIAREQEGRTGREDAWRKLLSAQHTLSPGARPQLAGQYNIAPRQATGAERTGADALSSEVMARLQGGNPLPEVKRRDPLESIDPKLLKAGKLESILGYASPVLRYLGG